jgi:RNA polymerase II subunit A-like phosphatase
MGKEFEFEFSSCQISHRTALWKVAEAFGAQCHLDLDSQVTHLIALKTTEKVKKAQARKVHVVHLHWLVDSIKNFEQADEGRYPVVGSGEEGLSRQYLLLFQQLYTCYVEGIDTVLHRPSSIDIQKSEESHNKASQPAAQAYRDNDDEEDDFLKSMLGDEDEDSEENEDEEDEEKEPDDFASLLEAQLDEDK